jgi:hypothetical protein
MINLAFLFASKNVKLKKYGKVLPIVTLSFTFISNFRPKNTQPKLCSQHLTQFFGLIHHSTFSKENFNEAQKIFQRGPNLKRPLSKQWDYGDQKAA